MLLLTHSCELVKVVGSLVCLVASYLALPTNITTTDQPIKLDADIVSNTNRFSRSYYPYRYGLYDEERPRRRHFEQQPLWFEAAGSVRHPLPAYPMRPRPFQLDRWRDDSDSLLWSSHLNRGTDWTVKFYITRH